MTALRKNLNKIKKYIRTQGGRKQCFHLLVSLGAEKVTSKSKRKHVIYFQQYDVQLGITLKEACLGTRKRVRMMIEKECSDCGGSGAKKGTQPVVSLCDYQYLRATFKLPQMLDNFCYRFAMIVMAEEQKQQCKGHS